MRVLLVQNFHATPELSNHLVFPIGLSCLASALERAGHEPWIVHLDAAGGDPLALLREEIGRTQPEVVGVSQRNIDSTTRKAPAIYHTQLRQTLAVIRAEAPGVPVVVGGPGFTQSSAAMMRRYAYDFGVHAEGEETFVELLDHLSRPGDVPGLLWRDESGAVRATGERAMPDFAALPYPRRHHVDWNRYRVAERERGVLLDVGVETTRGCPRRCAYCNYPRLNGRALRRKPPSVVADEIADLRARFDVRFVTFTDSRFNEDPRHAEAICQELIRRDAGVEWLAWLGFDGVDRRFLELLWEAGCRKVSFSPDGLLQPSLDRMRKDTTTAQIAATVRAVRQVRGLKASWSFFCTPPGTSRREQAAMLAWYAWIHGSLRGRGRMTLSWCRVEEGTHVETIAREDGVLRDGVDLLPENPDDLFELFYVPPGFERYSRFWDRFLDLEMGARVALARALRPLGRLGVRDLTPAHLRRKG